MESTVVKPEEIVPNQLEESENVLFVYEKDDENEELITCQHCCMHLSTKFELTEHLIKFHKEKYEQKDNPRRPMASFKCSTCSLVFNSKQKLKHHVIREHKAQSMQGQNGLRIGSIPKWKYHPCPKCTMVFRIRKSLESHLYKIHLDMKPIFCEFCPKQYAQREELIGHLQRDHNLSFQQANLAAAINAMRSGEENGAISGIVTSTPVISKPLPAAIQAIVSSSASPLPVLLPNAPLPITNTGLATCTPMMAMPPLPILPTIPLNLPTVPVPIPSNLPKVPLPMLPSNPVPIIQQVSTAPASIIVKPPPGMPIITSVTSSVPKITIVPPFKNQLPSSHLKRILPSSSVIESETKKGKYDPTIAISETQLKTQTIKKFKPAADIISCENCIMEFKDKESLRKHMETEHPSTYVCPKCDIEFSKKMQCKSHFLEVHELVTKVNCPYPDCSFGALYNNLMMKHIKKKHQNDPKLKAYPCNACQVSFLENLKVFKRHMYIEHSNDKRRRKTYDCDICDFSFTDGFELAYHTKKCHQKVKIKCKHCEWTEFSSTLELVSHLEDMHPEVKNKDTKKYPRRYPCSYEGCDFITLNPYTIVGHVNAVHKKLHPYKCPSCDATFSKKSNYTQHFSAVHERKKQWPCPTCDAAFTYKSSLTKHLSGVHNIQEEIKPGKLVRRTINGYPCHICQSKFTRKDDLLKHIVAKHDKARTEHCHLCGASFCKKAMLTRHLAIQHNEITGV